MCLWWLVGDMEWGKKVSAERSKVQRGPVVTALATKVWPL